VRIPGAILGATPTAPGVVTRPEPPAKAVPAEFMFTDPEAYEMDCGWETVTEL
jgi:hypothetical protein